MTRDEVISLHHQNEWPLDDERLEEYCRLYARTDFSWYEVWACAMELDERIRMYTKRKKVGSRFMLVSVSAQRNSNIEEARK